MGQDPTHLHQTKAQRRGIYSSPLMATVVTMLQETGMKFKKKSGRRGRKKAKKGKKGFLRRKPTEVRHPILTFFFSLLLA